jgi:hypothetical protein
MQWVNKAKISSDAALTSAFVAYEPSQKGFVVHDEHGPEVHRAGADLSESPGICVARPDSEVALWCDEILHKGLETIVGLSLGRYGCPFM